MEFTGTLPTFPTPREAPVQAKGRGEHLEPLRVLCFLGCKMNSKCPFTQGGGVLGGLGRCGQARWGGGEFAGVVLFVFASVCFGFVLSLFGWLIFVLVCLSVWQWHERMGWGWGYCSKYVV